MCFFFLPLILLDREGLTGRGLLSAGRLSICWQWQWLDQTEAGSSELNLSLPQGQQGISYSIHYPDDSQGAHRQAAEIESGARIWIQALWYRMQVSYVACLKNYAKTPTHFVISKGTNFQPSSVFYTWYYLFLTLYELQQIFLFSFTDEANEAKKLKKKNLHSADWVNTGWVRV